MLCKVGKFEVAETVLKLEMEEHPNVVKCSSIRRSREKAFLIAKCHESKYSVVFSNIHYTRPAVLII